MAIIMSFTTKSPITEFAFKDSFLVIMEGNMPKEVLLVFDPFLTKFTLKIIITVFHHVFSKIAPI